MEEAALRIVEKAMLDAGIGGIIYSRQPPHVVRVHQSHDIVIISVSYDHLFVDYPNGAVEFDLADPDFAQHAATLVKDKLPEWSKFSRSYE